MSHVKFIKNTSIERRYPLFNTLTLLDEKSDAPSPNASGGAKKLLLNKIFIGPSQNSGEFFELNPINGMVGPSVESMIQTGARFTPCMKPIQSMPASDLYVCLKTTTLNENLNLLAPSAPHWINSSCSLAQICGMASFHQDEIPDQTVRFITPLVVHSGIIHLFLNVILLLVLGIKLEKSINPLRASFLFVGSGLFGHVFGANFAVPLVAYSGCSSSFFGYIGYFCVDTVFFWKNIEKKVYHLIRLSLFTVLCFLLGLLPG
ncbi:hypothetical protein BY458DRAFT_458144 [Sporodiniella umbellata]|nr:hypothetical protein BY458DRAFT_458144 [Sporodiniella umbellata]